MIGQRQPDAALGQAWCFATPELAAQAVAALRSELAALGWERDRIDREVIVTYGEPLRQMGLDEVGTEDMFPVAARETDRTRRSMRAGG